MALHRKKSTTVNLTVNLRATDDAGKVVSQIHSLISRYGTGSTFNISVQGGAAASPGTGEEKVPKPRAGKAVDPLAGEIESLL